MTEAAGDGSRGRRMKGQFFLLAAFFFLLVFYLGVSVYLSQPFAGPAIDDGISGLFENVQNEFPRAANLGLEAGNPAYVLADFSAVAIEAAQARGAGLTVLWMLTESSGDDLNVTVGNFLGTPINVTLNVSGETRELAVADGEASSAIFVSPPSEFGLRLNFNTEEKNLILEKYKANLYTVIGMAKGDDAVRGEMKS